MSYAIKGINRAYTLRNMTYVMLLNTCTQSYHMTLNPKSNRGVGGAVSSHDFQFQFLKTSFKCHLDDLFKHAESALLEKKHFLANIYK